MLNALAMFNIGIGPSSSHTLGPMKAARLFLMDLQVTPAFKNVNSLRADLYGSLSLTGKGHQTDQAIILGLMGYEPETVPIADIPKMIGKLKEDGQLDLGQSGHVALLKPDEQIIFHDQALPLHENGMVLTALAGETVVLHKTYYSIGGGVVVEENDFGKKSESQHIFPYSFAYAQDLLDLCERTGLSIAGLMLENELSLRSKEEVFAYCHKIWDTMKACIERGKATEGLLPGPLHLHRRAPHLHRRLKSQRGTRGVTALDVLDWLNMYALAVSEENAAGGRVVTAPTNGACGVIPAVLAYYNQFVHPVTDDELLTYFLTSGAVGLLYRMNASISGAEVGCQGEIGVACSMAAAGLCALWGSSPAQVLAAAEIGMEHNLGLTCDPVGGQVQIPCIERNAVNAVTAVNAASMARERVSNPAVSLDKVIEAMFSTGKDMNAKYRETAQGGLAKVISCS